MPEDILLLATTNPGKVKEIKSILKGLPFHVVTPSQLKLSATLHKVSLPQRKLGSSSQSSEAPAPYRMDAGKPRTESHGKRDTTHFPIEIKGFLVHGVNEVGETFAQNAALKAKSLGKRTNLLTLADDSGLEVDALGGKPGVRSARFAKENTERIRKVLNLLQAIQPPNRTARFTAAIAIYNPQTGKTVIVQGKTEGGITTRPHGKNGFGYDPIFYSPELKKTFGQATLSEKNSVSHRARALEKARVRLTEIARERNRVRKETHGDL